MQVCELCGKDTSMHGQYRWFKYDNGEMVRLFCCVGCLWQHDVLVNMPQPIPTINKT